MAWNVYEDVAAVKADGAAAAVHSENRSLVGQSAEIRRLSRMVAKVGLRRHPVLLLGEPGTGKESVARAIHAQGLSPERPFVAVDCPSATPALFETEMFARVRGTFAMAGKPKDRLAEIAGTIFLDEICNLSPELQAKLVRALQEREIRSASDAKTATEARIIAASSRDLELAVQQGTFRRDLYVRLNLASLRLPPLRDRKEDVGLLADDFLARMTAGKNVRRSLSTDARRLLMNYDWPGNLRELKECLEYTMNAASGPVLDVKDLPPHIQHSGAAAGTKKVSAGGAHILPLAEVERQTILSALEQLNGDKLMTARALGIGKTTLYRKLKEYGICVSLISRPLSPR
jgi:two-component system response regulator HydG